jgi:arylsulfatase A-like enzyme
MKTPITRRDFLKLAGLLPLSMAAPKIVNSLPVRQNGKAQNVIVLVFDAFSAHNINLYGYQRETAPNITRWAERAVVYHNHHAGGNFTTPGTASLLTGTLPWTHRALGYFDTVDSNFENKNIFSAFPNHYRLAYTHNPVANRFLSQFSDSIDDLTPQGKLLLANDEFLYSLFGNDEDIANVSWIRAIKRREEGYAYSLFLARLYEKQRERAIADLRSQFPAGIPHIATDDYFLLEDAINWLGEKIGTVPQPFMGYFHLMPPHGPYLTNQKNYDYFKGDGFTPIFKARNLFADKKNRDFGDLLRMRTNYDEFIRYVDQEFGRVMDAFDSAGLLENSWVILTSDHGEMFERGIRGHWTPVLYQPVINIPLMIFEPGQHNRRDIYANTSAVDLLPTLLHVTELEPAIWTEGRVLPPFVEDFKMDRDIYVVQSLHGEPYLPLTAVTTTLIKERYKLMYFLGYDELGSEGARVELYDLENDPDELNELSSTKPETTAELLNEVKKKLAEVNEPYL